MFCLITLFSLFTQQVAIRLLSLFSSLFGFFVLGFYGLNVTICVSMLLLLLYSGCLTKLNICL
ncbi:hypothetical protein MtrunA17_Chr6g0470301 [Medicago truncatula]|uniref:Transmembrane protein n=1 Tax=Medicago truncatula TaxID=3880 RepID=A0A396HJZ8_MEDTR|nr:hypothetical protein MtrunA17_Chr6g0470301 [Medicago truncatula]